ncbi:iron-containing alcohol dehydrogenase [Pleomorphomonas carboxyditropha]|uniref:Uncharacterized protein n=1 Tax=Pleomorphomonas carboxyditropha TaxID=2023338 RepID=A0A2G9WQH1_9HYPH|nr:iron-containing alcohol dehydrogenase [Pleomorphomonas carboxyditropha]PIO96969.1 hypothetical protein CJ014_22800 [Pleomorphomonas carboxyditropha]
MLGKYAQTCPVHFGRGAVAALGGIVKDLGATRVLVVTDQGVAATEGYARALDSLKSADLAVTEFTKVIADPPDSIVDEGGALARAAGIDGIVAIGGGSPMDAAKAINVLVHNDGPVNAYLGNPFYKPGVPLVMVPTTSGTGSENTSVGVVTDTAKGIKSAVIGNATAAVVDPEMTLGVPPAVTANTGMDVLAQAAESLTSKARNPMSTVLAADAVRRVVRWLPVAVEDGADYRAREELAIASNFTGIAFNDALVHLGHAIAHTLGAKFHLTHGTLCALALPEVMKYAATAVPDRVRLVAEAAGVALADGDDDAAAGEKLAAAFRAFSRSLGIPSLAALGVDRRALLALAPAVTEDACYAFAPREMTVAEIEAVLAAIYDNY